MKDGLAFVDHIGWDAFNESKDLKKQVDDYRLRFGYYPEVVLTDQLYRSRENSISRTGVSGSEEKRLNDLQSTLLRRSAR